MQIGAKQQKISELRTGAHVKKGIFGFTTGLNRLLDFFPQNYIILFVCGGGAAILFTFVACQFLWNHHCLWVGGGGSVSLDFVST